MSTTISGDTGVDKATNQAVKDAMGVTGTAPVFGCSAWVNFDGTRNESDSGASVIGQNVKIRASGNVSSVVKNAVGEYTVNFTAAMPDSSSVISATAQTVTTNGGTLVWLKTQATSSMTTSSVRLCTGRPSMPGTAVEALIDIDYVNVAVFR